MADNVRQLPAVVVDAGWTKEQQELVKRMVCPKGITDDEFQVFMHQCLRSGLDPLIKQAFCVPRRQNIAPAGQPKVMVEKREFQPSESGMLARAQKFPDFRGVTAQAVRENDECKIDPGAGEVHHVFVPGVQRGKVIGAWARLARQDKLTIVVWLDYAAYAQNSPLWGSMPDTMMEKCARVAALRRAYAADFGGLYIAEELRDDDVVLGPVVDAAPAKASTTTRAETISGKITAKLEQQQAAKTSRMTIDDQSTTPDRPALPPPSLPQTIEAPARPFDQLAELAAAQATTARELVQRAGVPQRRTKGEVTAEDVEQVKAFLAKAEPPPSGEEF